MENSKNLVVLAWTRLSWWRRTLCMFGVCDLWYWITYSASLHEDTYELSRYLRRVIDEGRPVTYNIEKDKQP